MITENDRGWDIWIVMWGNPNEETSCEAIALDCHICRVAILLSCRKGASAPRDCRVANECARYHRSDLHEPDCEHALPDSRDHSGSCHCVAEDGAALGVTDSERILRQRSQIEVSDTSESNLSMSDVKVNQAG